MSVFEQNIDDLIWWKDFWKRGRFMADVKGDFTDPAGRKFDTLRITEIHDKPASGSLIVAITEDGKNVVVNHPDLQPDAEGCGHIVFSTEQAVNLALLLIKKANVIKGMACGECGDPLTDETGWATARFSYCFKDECQQAFYLDAQSMIREVDPELAERMTTRGRGGMQPATFTCPKCFRVSHNPNDARERYCGACHEFFK